MWMCERLERCTVFGMEGGNGMMASHCGLGKDRGPLEGGMRYHRSCRIVSSHTRQDKIDLGCVRADSKVCLYGS